MHVHVQFGDLDVHDTHGVVGFDNGTYINLYLYLSAWLNWSMNMDCMRTHGISFLLQR